MSRPPTVSEHHPRRKRGFEAASKLVAAHLRGPATKRGFAEAKLLSRWAEIAGAEIAAIATPLTLRYGGKQGLGGTLVLLARGADAPVLQMRQPEIVARVNACYGYRAVSRVQITQSSGAGFAEEQAGFAGKAAEPQPAPDPAAMAEAQAEIAAVRDDRLRDALDRLAGHVLRRPNKTDH
ncbi:MAG: DciA family protein [Pseudomonadota bacterium]